MKRWAEEGREGCSSGPNGRVCLRACLWSQAVMGGGIVNIAPADLAALEAHRAADSMRGRNSTPACLTGSSSS